LNLSFPSNINSGNTANANNTTSTSNVTQKKITTPTMTSVYSFGVGRNGKLGQGSSLSCYLPHQIPQLTVPIKFVAAGPNASAFVTQQGTVLFCGLNSHGMFGVPEDYSRYCETFVELKIPNKTIIQVQLGGSHSLVLASDGTVYSMGSNHVRINKSYFCQQEYF